MSLVCHCPFLLCLKKWEFWMGFSADIQYAGNVDKQFLLEILEHSLKPSPFLENHIFVALSLVI